LNLVTYNILAMENRKGSWSKLKKNLDYSVIGYYNGVFYLIVAVLIFIYCVKVTNSAILVECINHTVYIN